MSFPLHSLHNRDRGPTKLDLRCEIQSADMGGAESTTSPKHYGYQKYSGESYYCRDIPTGTSKKIFGTPAIEMPDNGSCASVGYTRKVVPAHWSEEGFELWQPPRGVIGRPLSPKMM